MQRNYLSIAVAAVLLLWLPLAASAQQAGSGSDSGSKDAKTTELDTIRVLGSRRLDRSSDTTSPVPVDEIPMQRIAEQGAQFDIAQTLQYAAPSFNSTRQTGADGADLVDGAALRGLGSDQTLVLVNGKRHHTVSLVNIYGARDRGNTGTDLNAIPMLAIDRIEILRDGAAAQYGSDAIAGVMNIALKRRSGCESILGYGQYSRGDGRNWIASAYCGAEFAIGGHIAVTGEWQDRGRSNRATAENPLRTIGDSKVQNKTVYLNGDLPLGDAAEVYFTAGMQSRDASSAAWARGGVGSDDIPSRNSAAMYPDGFVPYIDGALEDRYGILGARGDIGQWHWDLSQTHGDNALRYDINHTLNASIANRDLLTGGSGKSPDSFDAGGFSFQQDTSNLDVSRYFEHWLHGVNLAFGAEQRRERYRIRAGEPGSYDDFDNDLAPLDGGNAGSQGFPGFQPSDVTNSHRDSRAFYADVEMNFSDRFMVDVAARHEHYSDFGSTLNGKLAASFKAGDSVLLRGSFSTGFRAPSLQQKYFSSTITDFIGGQPVDIVIAANNSALAQIAGVPNLVEETSKGATLGLAWTPRENLSLTVDAYRIEIDDRVVLSGGFDTTDPVIGPILIARGVDNARFFFNSVDTRTEGLDVTGTHEMALGGGKLNTYLGMNFSRTTITRIHTPPALVGREEIMLSERERLYVEQGAPRRKAVLGFDYAQGAWVGNLKLIHFGPQTLGTWSGPPLYQRYAAKTSADASITYRFSERAKLTLGAANIFDVFPSRQSIDETDDGHLYESVQFGLNGTAYFTRFWYKF